MQAASDSFRDTIGTLDDSGHRNWLYPKSVNGIWMQRRRWVAYSLLAFLFAGPFIRIGGQPLLLLDVLNRHFVILGQPFWPQDAFIAVLLMLTGIVFIALFTVAFGRIFCGWVCPQTIFMEHVFRRVETWIEGDASARRKLDAAPWTTDKIVRKSAKHGLFYAFSFVVGNTFLAYLIGSEALWAIVTGPVTEHVWGLLAMLMFSAVFYIVFARLREQVCIAACPYGRLQGVLLDGGSLTITYDHVRGEPRGKLQKAPKLKDPNCSGCNNCTCLDDTLFAAKLEEFNRQGDCIDCKACVVVCPTGIDIRNGTQLECINCTACIDACDDIMVKIGKPKGLVRYATSNAVQTKQAFRLTGRMKAYAVVMSLLVVAASTIIFTRSDVAVNLLRLPGTIYQEQPDGRLTNIYRYTLVNKTLADQDLQFRMRTPGQAELHLNNGGNSTHIAQQANAEGLMIVAMPATATNGLRTPIQIEVTRGNQVLATLETIFLGPAR